MTLKDRANAILTNLTLRADLGNETKALAFIEDQLRKTVEEERHNIIHASYSPEELQQIKAEAYEDAAKIADEDYYTAAQRIRARKDEVCK
jgi:hypothetical protein